MKQNNKLRIFIVEDNLLFQQLIAKELESISYALYLFTNGEDCIEKLQQLKPDVIVLDNNLEGPMTGLETLRAVRAFDTDLYIIIFSTEEGIDSQDNITFYGNFDYVEKTLASFTELKQKICNSQVYTKKIASL